MRLSPGARENVDGRGCPGGVIQTLDVREVQGDVHGCCSAVLDCTMTYEVDEGAHNPIGGDLIDFWNHSIEQFSPQSPAFPQTVPV